MNNPAATGSAPVAPSDLATAIRAQARLRPHAMALHDGTHAVDYVSLLDAAGRQSTVLHAHGMQPGDVVALVADRSIETLTLMLAVMLGGGACLPLDTGYPPARLAAMLEDARPRLLIAATPGQPDLPAVAGMRCVERGDVVARAAASLVSTALAPGELAYVLFTSGSSGRPKGVAMRSAVLARLIGWHAAHPRLGRPARTVQFAPLSFDVAFQEMFSSWATGGSLLLPSEAERRDPYALLALLAHERIERLFLPYVALQAMAEAVAAGGEMPHALRDVITAGEQLRVTPAIRALFGALPACVLHNHYGPTETHVVTAHELSGDVSTWPELPPIGRPLPHVRVRLVDAALAEVAHGAEGELLLGGDCLAAGYLHRPELTAERFIELDGARWYRSGDLARDDGDTVLSCLGRLDQQIKLDGYRIEPGEIEAVLGRAPAVAEAVVVAVDGAQGRRLLANVVPRDRQADDVQLIEQLRAWCEAQLPAYLRPHAFAVLPALPLTASGKIDRRQLARGTAEAPLTWPEGAPLAHQLTVLWEQLLGVDALGARDNLFDRGARSLTVVRALTELRRRGFHALRAVQIYEHPSVARLVALLSADPETPSPDAAVAARGEQQRAAFARFGRRPGASS